MIPADQPVEPPAAIDRRAELDVTRAGEERMNTPQAIDIPTGKHNSLGDWLHRPVTSIALFALVGLLPVGSPYGVAAQPTPSGPTTLHYSTLSAENDSTLWSFAVDLPPDPPATVVWRSESGDSHRQTFEVDRDGNTTAWTVSFDERATDYHGSRGPDGHLRVRGTIEGDSIDETFELAGGPLYPHLGIGLSAFVRSGRDEVDFWTFRPDERSVIELNARREGLDTVQVLGAPTPAVRVRWAPTGWRGLLYSRRFWFRAADGVLVRTDTDGGRHTVLVDITTGQRGLVHRPVGVELPDAQEKRPADEERDSAEDEGEVAAHPYERRTHRIR